VRTFLFWNLGKNLSTLAHLSCLVRQHSIDVLLLAESPTNLDSTLADLNTLALGTYREETKGPSKVRALTRLDAADFTHEFTGIKGRLAVWKLLTPAHPGEVLVGGVHLPSKAGGITEADQLAYAISVTAELYEQEDRSGHQNTVLVGDFNMHPYDAGMTHVTGVHGLMTGQLSRKTKRYEEKHWRRFYNPMWGLFGDRTPGPAGSYYWRQSVPSNTFWQMIDQALIRPSLIAYFNNVLILDNDGTHALVSSDGAPDITHLSDHLPILFKLDV
jgi:exonuclease III